ncbi:hypothetical protein GLOIN_2v1776455 [Rhizophagus irregularis DAOM 181602=DAOM 197198]|nr:hypothetical protein GLOIN_2v1776455 [Rhizophagus irregularis DAOM 181602=DAOM 197198]
MISLRYHNDIICKSISPRYLFNIIIISIRYCLKIQGFCKVYRLSDGPKKIFTREELLVVPSDTMLPPTHILY